MMMESRRSLLLVRHAQSLHNVAEIEALGRPEGELYFRYRKDLLDCPISPLGHEQVEAASQILNSYNVKVVFASPLRRTLMTATGLFKSHPNKPKIYAYPPLREIMACACDIPDNLDKIKKEFPHVDFTYVDMLPIKELWAYYSLKNEKYRNKIFQELQEKFPSPEDLAQNNSIHVLEKMEKLHPERIELISDVNERVREAKIFLEDKVKTMLGEDERLAVVAHFTFLKAFTATKFDENGEPLDGTTFANCHVFEYHVMDESLRE